MPELKYEITKRVVERGLTTYPAYARALVANDKKRGRLPLISISLKGFIRIRIPVILSYANAFWLWMSFSALINIRIYYPESGRCGLPRGTVDKNNELTFYEPQAYVGMELVN
ncbi:hypothetical protein BS47DRAFT_456644 [Hydnum rufescens UP504]|uniref:Uncharacterized protein n=1 Tax=Hydnum rufescens UP504 TaxID=1448309 RepID=A0A9P6AIZ4_9AGAM|nr:hypothetical protein BS47DRAFT_456644 [Hydnum rufescens UP504]